MPPLFKHNPAFQTEEQLVSSFVVRLAELELLKQAIRENTEDSNQHLLVIGARGMGKTSLVLRAMAAVRADRNLEQRWYPLVFGEEAYEVASVGELWLEALFHLAHQTGDDRWQQIHAELNREQDEQQLHDRALARLMDFADEQDRRILLIVENLNLLLGQQITDDHGWTLRHTLLNEPRLMLLATATSRFDEIDEVDKPMYDLFKVYQLERLDQDQTGRLWSVVAEQQPEAHSIRPLHILTGGNPRLIVVLASFAKDGSFRNLMENFTSLVDQHTEYFKSNLESLPIWERKVFVSLAEIWSPATAREVAQQARMGVNKVSSFLNRLAGRGAVRVLEGNRRGQRRYQVEERLYNIYHLMRRRGEQASRVRAVVEFMVHFYTKEMLASILAQIAQEACKLSPDQRQDHFLAFEEVLQNEVAGPLRHHILAAADPRFFYLPDAPVRIRDLSRELEQAYTQAAGASEHESRVVELLGLAMDLQEQPQKTVEAEQVLRKAVTLKPTYHFAWCLFASFLGRQSGREEEAEQASRKAIELTPDDSYSWQCLGSLLATINERHDEAEDAFRKAIDLQPDDAGSYRALGDLLVQNSERNDEAEQAYRKAIEREPDNAWFWGRLGNLVKRHHQRRREAEQVYRKAIELNPDDALSWRCLGDLLNAKPEEHHEAEQAYRKAIELEPEDGVAWNHLGLLLEKTDREKEAELAYCKANETAPQTWARELGKYYQRRGRYDEEEQVYRSALGHGTGRVSELWSALGRLLHEDMSRHQEAEEAYLRYLDEEPNAPGILIRLAVVQASGLHLPTRAADTLRRLVREHSTAHYLDMAAYHVAELGLTQELPEAEEWARQANEMEPELLRNHLRLAALLMGMASWRTALDYMGRILSDKEFVSNNQNSVLNGLVDACAAGYVKQSMRTLSGSASAALMEPLLVALHMMEGNQVQAPVEVAEVATDVIQRILERQRSQVPFLSFFLMS